ncbi:MAG: S9 family peptidase [Hungatella sp.]|nr:S9 family peptidase [Hungatella sp.]
MNAIKIETFTRFQFVSNPSFAPDGQSLAFVVQRGDLEDNDYKGDLYLYRCDDGRVRRLTTAGDAKSYVWTHRGTLLFPASRDKNKEDKEKDSTSYYEISPDGGEAARAFTLPVKATGMYRVDEDRYLVMAVTELAKRKEGKDEAYEVVDEIPFWFNGKGFTNGLRNRLYCYRVSTGELTPISEESADVDTYSVRGSKVLYKAYPWTDIHDQYDGIYLCDLDTGENRCLLEKDTRRTGMIGFWADDEAVVASGVDNPHGNGKYMDFYTMNLETGRMNLLAEYDYSSGSGSVGSDARLGGGRTVKAGDGICYFVTTRGDSAHLYAIKRDGTLEGIVTDRGSCDSFDVKDGHVVVCGLYGDRLAELYLDGTQITEFNDMSQWQVCPRKEYTMKAGDGYDLTGWVMEPAGYEPGKKYPAILHIHGGPRTVFGTVFHHEMQMWANAGYFVFFTNPRGSDGFGTEFGDINGKYGTVDYDNLMEFTDYVLDREPDIDRERVGVTGGSYGGFMTNWIIGHTDRFRAAASQRSIANWISFEYMSDIGHTFTKDNQAAFACEDVEKLWFHSPIKYIEGCRTPTLFVHSDQDYRCNIAEGMEMFAALKVLGVDTRMLVVKGETHELSRSGRPRNRIVRMREILNWMDRYLKTEDAGKEEQ